MVAQANIVVAKMNQQSICSMPIQEYLIYRIVEHDKFYADLNAAGILDTRALRQWAIDNKELFTQIINDYRGAEND